MSLRVRSSSRPPFVALSAFVCASLLSGSAFAWTSSVPSDGTDEAPTGSYAIPDRSVYDSFGDFLRAEGAFADKATFTDCYWSEGGAPGVDWVVFASTNRVPSQDGVMGFRTYLHGSNGWERAIAPVRTALGWAPCEFVRCRNSLYRLKMADGRSAVFLQGAGSVDVFWEQSLDPSLKARLGENSSLCEWSNVVRACESLGVAVPEPSVPQRWRMSRLGTNLIGPTHLWRYLSDSQISAERAHAAERLSRLPSPVSDPSAVPVHVMDDENQPYDERWRILVDLDSDGHDDMLLSEGCKGFGNAGGGFDVYRFVDGRYLWIGDMFLHPGVLQFEDVREYRLDEDEDGLRVWSYWHLSGTSGSVCAYRIGRFGVSGKESFMAYGCEGESTPGFDAFRAVLGARDRVVPYVVQHSRTSSEGVVEWIDDNRYNRPRPPAANPTTTNAPVLASVDSPAWVAKLPAATNATQLFVVAGIGMDKTTAFVSMHEKGTDGRWRQILSTPGFVGKNGLCADADHREGCAQTPIGVYRFNKAFGIAPDPGCAIPYVRVDGNAWWSGDPDRHYNRMVDIRDVPDLVLDDSEHIVDYDCQYQYCLNIGFNEDGTPGRGSAIFLHCFGPQKPWTGGCVAVPKDVMLRVMRSVRADCVVVIDTFERLGASW